MSETSGPDETRGRLAAGAGGLDRAVREDFEKMLLEKQLVREDAAAFLTQDIEHATQSLEVAELKGLLDNLEGKVVPALPELENLLASTEAGSLEMEKNLLTDLLREGNEGQEILKNGLIFLKRRRYAEAAEWWSLNRAGLDPSTSRLHLLLLILECLTYHWGGDARRAQALRDQVRAHRLFRG